MYCGNCGAKNDDTAAFCQACGAPLKAASPANTEVAVTPHQQADRKKGIIAVVAAVVVILLAAWLLFGGRSYKTTVENLFESCLDGDVQGVMDLFPDDMIESEMESMGLDEGDMRDVARQFEQEIRGMMALSGVIAKNVNLDIQITGDHDVTGQQLENLQRRYWDDYDVKVRQAKVVNVNVSVDTSILSGAQDLEIPVIKVGRSWYIDATSF